MPPLFIAAAAAISPLRRFSPYASLLMPFAISPLCAAIIFRYADCFTLLRFAAAAFADVIFDAFAFADIMFRCRFSFDAYAPLIISII